jgi:sugar phosphate permease
VAVAFPLGIVGIAVLASRRKPTSRTLSVVTISLGLGAVLLPTVLVGVCASEDMICNMVMKPTLLFAGILTMAVGLVGLVYLRDDGSQGSPAA